MNSFDARATYLSFFERKGHTVVPSSSLIPAEDPTLLFANAGMNQFKDLFLGKERRSYTRATSSQKCVRAGGKHNDLDAVGFTARHLTFFEMLGNFSFGDYFKREAIAYAWELLTADYKLPAEKLSVTVFETDDEAYQIWHKDIGVPADRIYRLGEADNFWAMGDTGPCGPCTEIYYDLGPEQQGPFAQASPGSASPRYIEIWNLVFMQFNRSADGTLTPLAQTGVDTGMGLERLCMVLQGKTMVYQTDLFTPIIHKTEQITGVSYEQADTQRKAAFHVLADHVRSTSLLIADGCSPANEGRGYVLRKIIRRAALFAQKITDNPSLFVQLADHYIQQMTPVFPELALNKPLILSVLTAEVERFATNLVQGQQLLAKQMGQLALEKTTMIPGAQVFKLYDTYGFPVELTRIIAQEQGFDVDLVGFESAMKQQQEQSGKKKIGAQDELVVAGDLATAFVGYEKLDVTSALLFSLVQDEHAWVITQESPFYVESGGQVNDQGWVSVGEYTFPVVDLKKTGDLMRPAIAVKIALGELAHEGAKVAQLLQTGVQVRSVVDEKKRTNTVRNHTATHLLQAALIQVLGKQVKQAGSLVCPDYLRFDFTYHEALSAEQIAQVERLVNEKIYAAIPTVITQSTLKEAKEAGVISFFGEKYNPERVRVVTVPGFSAELCGGTHAHNTGIIGACKITAESSLATGTRRIIAVTGPAALELFQQTHAITLTLGEQFKVRPEEIIAAVTKLQEQQQKNQAIIRQLKKQMILAQVPAFVATMTDVAGLPYLYAELEEGGLDECKLLAQELEKQRPGLYYITAGAQKQAVFLCYHSQQAAKKIDLKALGLWLKEHYHHRGGGNHQALQGTVEQRDKSLPTALSQWLLAQ